MHSNEEIPERLTPRAHAFFPVIPEHQRAYSARSRDDHDGHGAKFVPRNGPYPTDRRPDESRGLLIFCHVGSASRAALIEWVPACAAIVCTQVILPPLLRGEGGAKRRMGVAIEIEAVQISAESSAQAMACD